MSLAAKDATYWAKKESKDDKPFLARFLFLKAMWECVIDDDDASWMKNWADRKHPTAAAVEPMLAEGIDPDDLTDVARDMQVAVLLNVCCALDDSAHGIVHHVDVGSLVASRLERIEVERVVVTVDGLP